MIFHTQLMESEKFFLNKQIVIPLKKKKKNTLIVIENIILVLKMVLDSKIMATNRAHSFGYQERDGIEGVAETT